MKNKNTEKEAAQKELAQQKTEDLTNWQSKLQHHLNSLIIIATVVVLAVVATAISILSQKERAEKAWRIIGEVWQTTSVEHVLPANFFQSKAFFDFPSHIRYRDENFPPEFKIKDLREPARKFLHDILGDARGLPEVARVPDDKEKISEDLIEKTETEAQSSLDNITLRSLPPSLAQKALRLHNIEILEQQLTSARNTTVGPWICNTLVQMYSDNPAQRGEYMKILRTEYPDFPLLSPVVIPELKPDPGALQTEWTKKDPQLLKYDDKLYRDATGVSLTTSRGKVKLVLLEQESRAACRHFVELANSGFFNGLNFYRVENEKVWSGCPIGNGKGEPDHTVSEKKEDVWPHRGLVFLDNSSIPGKVGSRFFIIKKFADLNEQYVVLGIVSEGMDVVDQLTRDDLLLDVSISR